MIHEVLHTRHIWHSRGLDCGDRSIGTSCTELYGSPFSGWQPNRYVRLPIMTASCYVISEESLIHISEGGVFTLLD